MPECSNLYTNKYIKVNVVVTCKEDVKGRGSPSVIYGRLKETHLHKLAVCLSEKLFPDNSVFAMILNSAA